MTGCTPSTIESASSIAPNGFDSFIFTVESSTRSSDSSRDFRCGRPRPVTDQPPPQRGDHVVRLQRLAVVEGDTLAQREGPHQAVGAHRPFVDEHRARHEPGVRREQRLLHVVDDVRLGADRVRHRVERERAEVIRHLVGPAWARLGRGETRERTPSVRTVPSTITWSHAIRDGAVDDDDMASLLMASNDQRGARRSSDGRGRSAHRWSRRLRGMVKLPRRWDGRQPS